MEITKADKIAKYPFLDFAGDFLKEQGLDLEKIATDPDYKLIIDKAYHRIEAATDGKIYKTDVVEDNIKGDKANDIALTREVLSFIVAIILLKLSGMNTLIQRFSLAEARRAEKYLERDLLGPTKTSNTIIEKEQRTSSAIEIIKELFSVNIQKQNNHFTISVSDYLKHAIHFHEKEWKLVNRQVDQGLVFLTTHEIVRLFRKELGNYINLKIKSTNTPSMLEAFEKPVKQLVAIAKKFSVKIVTSTEFPPCIKHAIAVLENGENLSHSGRFLLGTYLLGRGQTIEQIAPLFKNAPDYNEKVTLYQLTHLAGQSGSRTKYSCPSCEKIESQNLCFATPECDNIINPTQFGKKKTINA